MGNEHKIEPEITRHPSKLTLWLAFLVSTMSLIVPHYLGQNVWLIFAALLVMFAWTLVGRRWYARGFHQAFDMLAMFSYLMALAALGIAVYQLWG